MKVSTVFLIGGTLFAVALVISHFLILRSNIENVYLGAFFVSLQLIYVICIVGCFYNYGWIKKSEKKEK